MAKKIMSVKYEGRWVAHSDEVLDFLGVKRLPDEGMPERLIQGVRVYVLPKPDNGTRHMVGLRVMAICECGRHLAVGRLHQHKCKGV